MTEYDTNPTIETVLEKIETLRTEMHMRFDNIFKRLRRQQDIVDTFIEEVIEMRRDLKELDNGLLGRK